MQVDLTLNVYVIQSRFQLNSRYELTNLDESNEHLKGSRKSAFRQMV